MKAKELLKDIRKEFVFDVYTRIVEETKDYEQLSRYKMYEEVLAFYNNCSKEKFLSYIGKMEMEILEQILAGTFHYKLYHFEVMNVLSRKGFLFFLDSSRYEIPEEIKEILKKNIGKKLSDESVLRMDVEELSYGILRTHGMFSARLIAQIVSEYMKDFAAFEIYDMLMDSNNLPFYMSVFEETEHDIIFVNRQYAEYYDVNVIMEGQFYDYEYTHYRTKVQYIAMAKYGYNIYNPKVKKFFERLELKSDNLMVGNVYKELLFAPHFNMDLTKEVFFMQFIEKIKDIDFTQVEEIQKNMFSAALVGNTWYEYHTNEEIKKREKRQIFSYEEVEKFFDVYMALLQYTNDIYKINKDVNSIVDREFDSAASLVNIRKHLFQHKQIIDDFIAENPFSFSAEYQQIAEDFKLGILDFFIVCEVNKEYALLMDKKQNIYKIVGLHSDLKLVLMEETPFWLETLLIPFKSKIIYDGIVSILDVEIKENEKLVILDAIKDKGKYTTTFMRFFN